MVMNQAGSTAQLTGVIKDDKAITLIGGAVVAWKDKTTISKDDGSYTLDGITPGTQKVTVSKAYYTTISENVQIKAGPTTIKNFSLTQQQKDIRKKPYLVLTGDNTSMAVTWQTFNSHPAHSMIQWGTTSECKDGSETVKENSAAKDEHVFYHEIKNLKPATKIFYRVTVGKEVFTGEFGTPPEKNADSLVFYCYGDTRTQPFLHDAVLKDMMKNMDGDTKNECHTLLINGGDFVSRGLMENYWDDEYFNPDTVNVQKFLSQIPILGVLGNHECAKQVGKTVDWDWKNAGKLYRKYWPYPTYPKSDRFYISYEYGPVHFSVLEVPLYFYHYQKYNAAQLEEQKKMWQDECEWLDKDLASTAKEWKIVALHMPVYSSNTYNQTLDTDLSGLFKKHNVKIVLQSHVHNYSRVTVQGIQYTTCGGGGAPLQKTGPYNSVSAQYPIHAKEVYNYARFDVSGKTLNVSIFGADSSSLDRFEVQDTFTVNL